MAPKKFIFEARSNADSVGVNLSSNSSFVPSSLALAKRKFQGLPSVVVVEVAKLRFEKISLSSFILMPIFLFWKVKFKWIIYFIPCIIFSVSLFSNRSCSRCCWCLIVVFKNLSIDLYNKWNFREKHFFQIFPSSKITFSALEFWFYKITANWVLCSCGL